ncbi:substrate-binding periplasmic protein [Alteromonas halophila]|uniref:Polar amino acid ABC transporter n=1 Tax=Alteromonas halophila TaxID=516698 RepID=A0A918N0N5_9ALTE|nr:transporter substrate-binding domain-containing protein [Alteromonas halophila]GGW90612.1 polar amino acid ABC transporter [Alteromonas halophila]
MSASVLSKTLDVVVGWNKPPYVMSDADSGFELELVRQILHELGHEMRPVYVPMGRTMMMVAEGEVDMGLTMNLRHTINATLLTDPYVIYQNVAVTRQDRQLDINSIDALAGHSVIAFQTATEVLGPAFARMIERTSGYLEVPEQRRQVSMLLLGSVDVAVLDRNIFTYLKGQLPDSQQHATVIHELFSISPYSAAIHDPVLREQFDEVLAEFIADGRYQALLDRFGLVNLHDRLPAPDSQFAEDKN